MKQRLAESGFTLLEMTVAVAILIVVTLLTFIAIQSSTSVASVANAKEIAQATVRDVLTAITAELQMASKTSNDALVPPLAAVQIPNPQQIVFQVPQNATGTVWSQPISFTFVNEDITIPATANNARLDEGEDQDGDGTLTRRIVRTQAGVETPVGGANSLSNIQFQLNPTNDIVTVTLTATVAIEKRRDVVSATATGNVYLLN
jgi:type II secretory pathway pseudopilin PulG